MTYFYTLAALVTMVVFGLLGSSGTTAGAAEVTTTSDANLQTLALQQPAQSIGGAGAVGGPIINIVGEAAVVSSEGMNMSESADLNGDAPNNKQASIYVVREGDTLSAVAEMFDVSVNTIEWANNLDDSINPGDVLVILPVSGVRHEVEKGDTLSSIAELYDGDIDKIRTYNELKDSESLSVGAVIDVPGGTMPSQAPQQATTRHMALDTTGGGAVQAAASASVGSGFFTHPAPGSVITQRSHGYGAVDFGAPSGTSILAAASGEVTKSVAGGWNGGYGQFIVIRHDNGVETLYSHMSSVIVSRGQRVVKGQVIGYMGSTGRSTGSHLHFEVRGTHNPFADCGLRTSCGS